MKNNKRFTKNKRINKPLRTERVANSQVMDNAKMPESVIFYCKTHQRIINYKPETFNFKYPGCPTETDNLLEEKKLEICELAYGSERSIKRYYKIKDERFDQERKEREEKATRADKL